MDPFNFGATSAVVAEGNSSLFSFSPDEEINNATATASNDKPKDARSKATRQKSRPTKEQTTKTAKTTEDDLANTLKTNKSRHKKQKSLDTRFTSGMGKDIIFTLDPKPAPKPTKRRRVRSFTKATPHSPSNINFSEFVMTHSHDIVPDDNSLAFLDLDMSIPKSLSDKLMEKTESNENLQRMLQMCTSNRGSSGNLSSLVDRRSSIQTLVQLGILDESSPRGIGLSSLGNNCFLGTSALMANMSMNSTTAPSSGIRNSKSMNNMAETFLIDDDDDDMEVWDVKDTTKPDSTTKNTANNTNNENKNNNNTNTNANTNNNTFFQIPSLPSQTFASSSPSTSVFATSSFSSNNATNAPTSSSFTSIPNNTVFDDSVFQFSTSTNAPPTATAPTINTKPKSTKSTKRTSPKRTNIRKSPPVSFSVSATAANTSNNNNNNSSSSMSSSFHISENNNKPTITNVTTSSNFTSVSAPSLSGFSSPVRSLSPVAARNGTTNHTTTTTNNLNNNNNNINTNASMMNSDAVAFGFGAPSDFSSLTPRRGGNIFKSPGPINTTNPSMMQTMQPVTAPSKNLHTGCCVSQAYRTYLFWKELECNLCQQLFTEPKVLPCGHSFCYGCLNKRYQTNIIVCVTCTAVCEMQTFQVATNHTLRNIVESIRQGSIL